MINQTNRSIEVERGAYKAYYGEDQTERYTGEWNFVIWKNGQEKARYSNSELLELSNGERPVDIFIAGLVKYFMR